MIADFEFGEWLPDQPDFQNPGLTECCNVYPIGAVYDPIMAPAGTGMMVSGAPIGAGRIVRSDGSMVLVVGTRADLFTMAGGLVVASDLSLSIAGDEAFWTFIPFGRMVWAFCEGQVPHYLPDTAFSTKFVPHPGVAPRAKAAGRIGDFIMTGNLEDIDATTDPHRIRWSRFNDPAGDWADDIALQSGAVSLPAMNGAVVAISSGDFGLVFQRYGISRLEYSGGVSVFARREISSGRGCASPASVVQVAGVTYFLSDDGFYRTDGATVSPISPNRVFSWFQSKVDGAGIRRTQGAIDWRSRCIVWSFEAASGSGKYTNQIIYSWEANRWSCAEIDVDWMFDTIKSGLSLEEVSAIYPNLDAMLVSLDSAQFKARGRNFSAIVNGEICDMAGENIEARFATGEIQPAPGYRSCVNGVAVLAENETGNSRVALGGRDNLKGGAIRWTGFSEEGPDGFAHPVIDSRYVRARIIIPARAIWQKASGIQVEFIKTGRT